jgi:hypothetical protein
MNSENLKSLAVFLTVLLVVLIVNNVVMTKRITHSVIEGLKRDYVPGPYEPGFDPDKVPPKLKG